MDVVELDQFDQTDRLAIVIDRDEAAFALIVHVLVVKLRQLRERFIRLLEPVTHDPGVVVDLVYKAQVVTLQRP
jgi:hypothetical protein